MGKQIKEQTGILKQSTSEAVLDNTNGQKQPFLETKNSKMKPRSVISKSIRYIWASTVFVVGFILSPLTWWNDLVVNLPIAWLVASVFPERWFKPAVIVSYWFTNIFGLLMMHFSGNAMIHKKVKPFTWRTFWEFMAWTTGYSLLFWLLMHFEIIQPINLTQIMEILNM